MGVRARRMERVTIRVYHIALEEDDKSHSPSFCERVVPMRRLSGIADDQSSTTNRSSEPVQKWSMFCLLP